MASTTVGNLGSWFTGVIKCNSRISFNRMRGTQGNQTVSIERFTVVGRDSAAGIPGTKTQVSSLADLAAVINDFTIDLARSLGENFQEGLKVFEIPDVQVLDGDYILWNSDRWGIISYQWEPNIETSFVVARKEE